MSDGIPVLADMMEFPNEPRDDDRRWVVLFLEDYHNFAHDPEGNVAVLVDQTQATELLRLSAQTIADLSPRDADADDVIRDMRDALDQRLSEGDDDA